MEPRKENIDLLTDWLKSEWPIFVLIAVSGFIFLAILPHFLIKTHDGWTELAATSTYVYTLITLCAFPVIAATAFLAYRQLLLVRKTLESSSYSQIYTHLTALQSQLIQNSERMKMNVVEATFTLEDLSVFSPERHILDMMFTLFENIYYQHEKFSAFDKEDWNVWRGVIKRTFAIPYIQKYWEEIAHRSYTCKFQKVIKRILAESDTPNS